MESSLFLKFKRSSPTADCLLLSTPTSKKGFTVLELLISLAIMGVIMAVAITGQSTYNKNILLTDTAYSVALSLRQAQSFGLSSKKTGTFQNAGYGIHFSDSTRSFYTFFADTSSRGAAPTWCPGAGLLGPESKPGNCLYDTLAPKDTLLQTYYFQRGYQLKRICAKEKASNTKYCTDGSMNGKTLNPITVVFVRPNSKVIMTGFFTIAPGTPVELSCMEVVVQDPTSTTLKTIRISLLGEISVGQSCP